ncbi:MAG: DNA topoisomerase IV subunit B, partial [Candidatus Pacebacteria bacterium]|nr:DNA topoisomerase IV subunit B [Candidatus Paceibacterota bacterium]
MAKENGNNKNKNAEYGAGQIQVLEGLAPVRKRPGMYIGGTGLEGLHHLIWEIVDNSIDEAMAGYCDKIEIEFMPDNMVQVSDNGRGIPVEKHKQTKKSTLETVLTVLHAGGKFEGEGYKVSGGLHGVGVSVVNALSVYLRAEVKRDGKLWAQEYKQGNAKSNIKAIGTSKETGTKIIFQPDSEIFPEIKFDWNKVISRMRQQAYLTKGVKIKITDSRDSEKKRSYAFFFDGGVVS